MGYRYDIAIRSTHKYAVRACGDVARVVDLPDGGVALLVIDGQGSGPSARAVARDVANRLSDLLEAGASAEVAASAANQALTAGRLGQVSVSFDIVRAGADGSLDLARFSTNTLCAFDGTGWNRIEIEAGPAGRSAMGTPDQFRCSQHETRLILVATDGVAGAGLILDEWLSNSPGSEEPESLADDLFSAVLDSYSQRPKDDVTLAILRRVVIPADQRFERIDYSREVR